MNLSRRRAIQLGFWSIPLIMTFAVTPARAFCRTRTCEFRRDRERTCPIDNSTGCSTSGRFVFWSDACIPFAVQRDGSQADAVSAATLEALVEDGFRVWSEVPCPGGGSPELAAGSQGPIACDAVEYECTIRYANSNIIMFRDDFVDVARGLRFGVIALTILTANLVSGEVYDADIEINSRDEDFVIDEQASLELGAPRSLRGVVNHELGHLLGLSHSRVPGALMREAYEGTEQPADDDIEAMCEALGSSQTNPICSVTELGSDAECVGSDVSCMTATADPEPRGCSCRFAGVPRARSSAADSPLPGLAAVPLSGLAAVPLSGLAAVAVMAAAGHLRRSRRRRSVL